MKIGDKIEFYLFSEKRTGEVYNIDKTEKTVDVIFEDLNILMFKHLKNYLRKNPMYHLGTF